jgi:hypothetical protein
MSTANRRLAILYPGDRSMRDRADPAESRFRALFEAFAAAGIHAEPAVYSDDFLDEVAEQLLQVNGVLVWHNPIERGRDRSLLDAMLRITAAKGIFVSTHPDTILKLGTKDVLLSVRDLPFGSDAYRVDSLEQLRTELPRRLSAGPRVLKQRRGHSGIGIWRVERFDADRYALWHAERGASDEIVDLDGVVHRLAPYFENRDYMIDQAWQPRMVEGMTRAYMVRDRVAGFGHQTVIALHPRDAAGNAVPTTPRLYSDPEDSRFQDVRRRLEDEWIGRLRERVGVKPEELPLLWDADFLLGDKKVDDAETYVLCEINVSSVAPFPESATARLVEATGQALASRP